jgi:hypothetical protein
VSPVQVWFLAFTKFKLGQRFVAVLVNQDCSKIVQNMLESGLISQKGECPVNRDDISRLQLEN